MHVGWLTSNPQSGTTISSYCKLCDAGLRSHRADLLRHAKTTKHKLEVSKLSKQSTLRNFGKLDPLLGY